ncbi:MAG: transglutaminase family protein [Chromatiaceae bacterium]|nr:transglutaminase family protein [Chromatiaceae bacterium]
MKYHINHLTRYLYDTSVSLCHNIAHLKPRDLPHQKVLSSHLRIDPWPAVSSEHTDFFGNRVGYFCIQQAHRSLEVGIVSEVEVAAPEIPDFAASPAWEQVVSTLREGRSEEVIKSRIFSLPSPYIVREPEALEFSRASFPPGRPILEAAADLMGRIYRELEFDPHFTTVATPIAEVLEHRKGVCQDFAHLGIAGLRALGLAARYVSGYLETLPPPGQPKLQGADASHAWFAVFVPGTGWVDFDPTNDQIPHEQHVTTALGRDFHDVTPLHGVFYGGGEHRLEVEVDVNRL